MASLPLHLKCPRIRTNRFSTPNQDLWIRNLNKIQERSSMLLSMPLEVGTTPGLLAPFMNNYQKIFQLNTTLFPTQHSHRVPVGALGRYAPLSQQVQFYPMIQMNSLTFLPSIVNSYHSDNLWNGGCVPCRVHSAASVSHFLLRIYHFGRICWRSVFASTTFG